MNILIIGNANSIWVKEYIENILLDKKNNITIFHNNISNNKYEKFYRENNIRIINKENFLSHTKNYSVYEKVIKLVKEYLKIFLHRNITFFITTFLRYKSIKKFDSFADYDIIHFHYITQDIDTNFYFALKNFSGKVIFSYHGSDILSLIYPCIKKCLKRATYITFGSLKLKEKFVHIYGNKYNKKLLMCYFGISMYNIIDKFDKITDYKINKKINIAIGYNSNKHQNHIEVLRAIKKIDLQFHNKIHLHLQFSYGNIDKEYFNHIYKILNESNISYTIIHVYQKDFEVSRLRNEVDIFINAQKSDSLSASMLEYIYANCIVINASWLKYPEL